MYGIQANPSNKDPSREANSNYMTVDGDNCSQHLPIQPMKFNMEVIDGSLIPLEVLVEILSRLPVRSLGRFRCVCKSWRSLISSSYFVKMHTSVAVADTSRLKFLSALKLPRFIDYGELLNNDPDDIYLRPVLSPKLRCKDDVDRFLLDDNRFDKQVVGSCNGLICLSCFDNQEQNMDDRDFFVFWNPSTGDTCRIPGTTSLYNISNFSWFGYDSTTEDYKIILGDRYKSAIDIFSQKEGSWTTVECQEHYDFLDFAGCLVNGALHWLQDGRIISFDLAKETFQEVARLTDFDDKDDLEQFAKIGKTMGDCLFAFVPDLVRYIEEYWDCDRVGYPIAGTIWVMKEYGFKKSWTKVVRIPEPADMFGIEVFLPDWILENGKVMMILKRGGLDEVAVYNPEGNTFSTVDCKTDDNSTFDLKALDSTFYIETLVSPKNIQ